MPDMSSSFLSAFLFAFPVLQLWSCFPSLVDWTFQVFGQLEYFNQRDELLFGELVIINAKGSEERTDLLFLGTALKIHRILQLALYGCCEGDFIRSHGVGTMLLSNVTEDTFQIICNQASEILVLSDLRDFQRPQMQVIFLAAVFINAICRTASSTAFISLTRISAIRST